mmetsp:Transcript_26990/g.83114  ORF Transcript_26990/g.83114 Transcript_26990/m.83114 type:complete len:209 (-) Transcript_26990:168-794(-)
MGSKFAATTAFLASSRMDSWPCWKQLRSRCSRKSARTARFRSSVSCLSRACSRSASAALQSRTPQAAPAATRATSSSGRLAVRATRDADLARACSDRSYDFVVRALPAISARQCAAARSYVSACRGSALTAESCGQLFEIASSAFSSGWTCSGAASSSAPTGFSPRRGRLRTASAMAFEFGLCLPRVTAAPLSAAPRRGGAVGRLAAR